ncbi:MAG: M28 family peptidase, partial [Lewinella sp.]|nr:M28 family peptidase [Lewinella sp.]
MKRVICLKYGLLSLALSLALVARAQAPRQEPIDEAAVLANTITVDELTRHLTILASDEMEGRETGQPGQRMAAEYLASVLADYGLPAIGADGTYFQPISFISENWANVELYLNGKELRHLRDYYALPSQNADREEVAINEVTFLGYGIDDEAYSDYEDAGDLTGKTILILSGEPQDRDGHSRVTGDDRWSDWADDVTRKLRTAREHGVATVIVLDAKFRQNLDEARRVALDSRMHMGFSENPEELYSNSIFISTETAKQLLGDAYRDVVRARKRIERRGRSRSVAFPADIRLTQQKRVRELLGENVLGYIEGTDPDLKDEVVILSAHYDHIGRRGNEIFNGADDNGSGSSTLLEICQAMAEA